MNNFIASNNMGCQICGKPEKDIPNHKHHIIPKSIGGTDLDGRICLCKKCHEIIHNAYPMILWNYVIDKESAKKALIKFVRDKIKYDIYSKTINNVEHNGGFFYGFL